MKITDYKKKIGKSLRQATLCFLVKDNMILLANKKRGFAAGKINGVGGKVNKDETIEDAVKRETLEEINVKIEVFEKVAVLDFYFVHNLDWNQQVIVFLVKKWSGEPLESEEMAPQWYPTDQIPYDKMWADDFFWLPLILKGNKVDASFLFNEKEEILERELKIWE